MKKIVCLVSHCPDALINKRLNILKTEYDVSVIYNERGNKNFNRLSEINYKKLSLAFDNGHLFKRIFYLLKLKKEIKREIKNENADCVYAFRLDMLILVLINRFKKKNIIYEVADLHEILINNSKNILKRLIKFIFTQIEKYACKYVDVLCLTSEKYYDVYFSKFVNESKVVYMPNMPDLQYFKEYKKDNHKEFTVGFIGFVRYKKQMKLLIEAAEKLKTRVLFAGDSQDDEIKQLSSNSKYVEYYGKYNYDTDIANLYAKCDCIYSVYDTAYNNVKYALPNKLYESIYCELPILVADGTYLGELVQKWGVGIKVDSNSLEDLIIKIKLLQQDKETYNMIIKKCKENKNKIDIEKYNTVFIEKLRDL